MTVTLEEATLARQRYLVDVHVLPLASTFDPLPWLSNFQQGEKEYAFSLLSSFLYFSREATESIFVTAVQNLSQLVVQKKLSYVGASVEWARFLRTALFVIVTGERPRVTDSGHLFARMVRDKLSVPDERILDPGKAISWLIKEPRDVIFVDDFCGSGEQFCKTWERRYAIGNPAREYSFKDLQGALAGQTRFFYVPVASTWKGRERLENDCRGVTLLPGHHLGPRYGAFSSESILWADGIDQGRARIFLKEASQRAGIPDTNGAENDWRGFNKLGLALAFEHGWPDSTMPIFYWDRNGWKPLLKK